MNVIKEKNAECLLFGDLYFQVDKKYFTEELSFFFFYLTGEEKLFTRRIGGLALLMQRP